MILDKSGLFGYKNEAFLIDPSMEVLLVQIGLIALSPSATFWRPPLPKCIKLSETSMLLIKSIIERKVEQN